MNVVKCNTVCGSVLECTTHYYCYSVRIRFFALMRFIEIVGSVRSGQFSCNAMVRVKGSCQLRLGRLSTILFIYLHEHYGLKFNYSIRPIRIGLKVFCFKMFHSDVYAAM